MTEIGILGIFRSGTNFARTILEWNYECRVVHNVYGWKHGFFPIIAAHSRMQYQTTDFIFVTKSPFASIESLYRYYVARGKNLIASVSWKEFLRTRIIVLDSFQTKSPEYRFANPVELWNALNWNFRSIASPAARCVHVQYEALLRKPEAETSRIAGAFGLLRRTDGESGFRVPVNRVRNMDDSPRNKTEDYVSSEVFDASRYGPPQEYLAQFDNDDMRFALNQLDLELVARLGYEDEISEVRRRLHLPA